MHFEEIAGRCPVSYSSTQRRSSGPQPAIPPSQSLTYRCIGMRGPRNTQPSNWFPPHADIPLGWITETSSALLLGYIASIAPPSRRDIYPSLTGRQSLPRAFRVSGSLTAGYARPMTQPLTRVKRWPGDAGCRMQGRRSEPSVTLPRSLFRRKGLDIGVVTE